MKLTSGTKFLSLKLSTAENVIGLYETAATKMKERQRREGKKVWETLD
jgi:hypothetical protein